MTETFVAESPIAAPAEEVFAFHERPGAFERLTPPYEDVEVVEREGSICDGDRTVLQMRLGPFTQRWVAEHRDYVPGEQFVDVQLSGPFKRWEHTHRVEPSGQGATMIDELAYELPLGGLGRAVAGAMVRRRLERMFAYRHAVLDHDARLHHLARERLDGRRLTVAVGGASGLIGRSLTALLESGGHRVRPLIREGSSRPSDEGIRWSPADGTIDAAALEGLDAVVNLAGEPIQQRWTDDAKARIRDSRVKGTDAIARAIAGLSRKPAVFVSGSAVGAYAERGFLREVCDAWEAAADPARDAGVRVVHPRMGIVLSPRGGALAELKTPFQLGLGGRVGSGEQPFSWVSIDDAAGALYFAIVEAALEGPYAVTGPAPVSNAELTAALGEVLGRPTLFPLPAAAVKLVFGQMGEEMLLDGQRAEPRALIDRGYPFAHRTLRDALRHVLGR